MRVQAIGATSHDSNMFGLQYHHEWEQEAILKLEQFWDEGLQLLICKNPENTGDDRPNKPWPQDVVNSTIVSR